jgi:hypothetical protein
VLAPGATVELVGVSFVGAFGHMPLERKGLCVEQNGENVNVHGREFLFAGIASREKHDQHFVEGFVIAEISICAGSITAGRNTARFVCLGNDGLLHRPQKENNSAE